MNDDDLDTFRQPAKAVKRKSRPSDVERDAPLLVIAAGGTGGHMFPAQALSERMLAKGWQVRLSTDERGARYTGGFSHAVQIEVVKSATFARGNAFQKALVPLRVAWGTITAAYKMGRHPPEIVVGFGGYPSIPAMAAAWVLRVPRMIHEQNGVLGRVNQIFAPRVNGVACGTWPTELPEGVGSYRIGNPVRQAVLDVEHAPYDTPGEHPMHIVVMGGSQGARVMSDHVPGAIAALPDEMRQYVRVSHQARDEDQKRVTDFYAQAGIEADVQPFFQDVPKRIAGAQLVISRAGASSVADISVIGRPSILVPLASAIRDEQTANARALVEAGGAILMPEAQLTAQSLSDQIELVLSQPAEAAQMAEAAYSVATPDAVNRLVRLVEQLSHSA